VDVVGSAGVCFFSVLLGRMVGGSVLLVWLCDVLDLINCGWCGVVFDEMWCWGCSNGGDCGGCVGVVWWRWCVCVVGG